MKHIVSVNDFTTHELDCLIDNAKTIKSRRGAYWSWSPLVQTLPNRLMITDFFEPSTRTRLSFEAAMTYLGGHAIGTENAAEFSSFKKGESLEDNFTVISSYCDVIVGRFRNPGEAARAAAASSVPLINGGDGTGEHPTQALIDLFSIDEHFKLFQNVTRDIKVVFFGDNKRSRTIQSLARLLATFNIIKKMVFVSPVLLAPDSKFIDDLQAIRNLYQHQDLICEIRGLMDPRGVLEDAQIVYVTRSQDERGGKVKDGLVFLPNYLDMLPSDAIILHPLPRNSELPTEIDGDRRAYYFEQAKNGLYVRMSLLAWLLGRIIL